MFDWHGQPGWLSRPGKLGRTDGWLASRNVGMAHELHMNCNRKRKEKERKGKIRKENERNYVKVLTTLR